MPSLSRRDLLRSLLAAGLTPTAASLLAACQPTASTSTPAQPTVEVKTGPKVGGELRVDVPADPPSLDPLRFNSVEGQRIWRLTNSQVLKWKADKSLEPDLAAAMPTLSADRLTYTIKLRKDVKWHDGKPFDSSDVKLTYETVLDSKNASVWRTALGFVKSVEAPDAETVIVTLNSPFTPLMTKFAQIPIISSKIPYEQNKTYANTLVGTGPYKFVSWQQGQQVVVERNPDYFVKEKPYLQRVTFRTVQESAARVTNLVNGTTQLLPEPPNTELNLLKQRGMSVVIAEESTNRIYMYPSMLEGRPTANADFRKAIAWALDRQTIVDQVYAGAAVPAATYLSSGSQYFDRTLGTGFGNKPDLTKAREALQRAGGAPGREIDLIVTNLPDLLEVGVIVQNNLKALGLNAKITVMEQAATFSKLLPGPDFGQYDLLLLRAAAGSSGGYSPDYPYLGLLSTSSSNFNAFKDPKMDDLVKAMVAAPEGPQAQAAYRAMQEYDLETVPQLQIVTARYVEAFSPKLKGYTPSGLFITYSIPDGYLE